jgi:hypothetical protein
VWTGIEQSGADCSRGPVLPVAAVLRPRLYDRSVGFVFGRQSFDRRKVAFEISAGNA